MHNGKLEPDDADVLMRVYRKINIYGFTDQNLTVEEMVLIFCLAKSIKEGKVVNKDE